MTASTTEPRWTGYWIGCALWILVTAYTVRDLRSFAWSSALLTFFALVLAPLLLRLIIAFEGTAQDGVRRFLVLAQLRCAVLLQVAVVDEPGWRAALLASPWCLWAVLLGWTGLTALRHGPRTPASVCVALGCVYATVGAAWTFADRLGLHPLGFGTDIVQLTAVHFHYAGLGLPVIAGLVLRETGAAARGSASAAVGVLLGIPLVALAITAGQFGAGTFLEVVAAVVLAPAAIHVAIRQGRLALGPRTLPVRILWIVASGALTFGMVLALLYSAREFVRWEFLNIPWMRALHGTANAIGFTGCATVGWWWQVRRAGQ